MVWGRLGNVAVVWMRLVSVALEGIKLNKERVWILACCILILNIYYSILHNIIKDTWYRMYWTENVTHGVAGSRIQIDIPAPRIFCLILANEAAWDSKRRAVQQTWAQRCDRYCFFYTVSRAGVRKDLDACPLHASDWGRRLTTKVFEALNYVHTHHRTTYDWVLKADDDSYIIMENLKAFLSQHNPSEAKYFGHVFYHEKIVPHGHPSGGAGYLLSAKTLDILLSQGNCITHGYIEDLDVAKCLQTLKIYPQDIRDENGMRLTFPEIWDDSIFKVNQTKKDAFSALSPHTVSIHHVEPAVMYFFEYFVYHFKRNISGQVLLRQNHTQRKPHSYIMRTLIPGKA